MLPMTSLVGDTRTYTCACAVIAPAIARLALVAVSLLVALSAYTAVPQAAHAAAKADRETVELASQARKLEQTLERDAEQLREAMAKYDEIQARRAVAQQRFDAHLRNMYMGGADSELQVVLAADSFKEAADAARALNFVLSYEQRLLEEITSIDVYVQQERNALEVAEQQLVDTSVEIVSLNQRIGDIAQGERAKAAAKAALRRAKAAQKAASAAVPTDLSMLAGYGTPALASSASGPAIDAYLASKGSPMVGSGQFFMMAGARWNLDPRLVVAIAGAESDFGKTTCADHNAWGWGCPTSPINFDSWATGIDSVAKGLRNYYMDEGRTTVAAIHQKYAPLAAKNDPTGLNSHWARNVSKFLLEQGANPNSLSADGGGFI